MFQEIAPDVLDTQYLNTPLSDDAYVVTIHQNQLLLVGEAPKPGCQPTLKLRPLMAKNSQHCAIYWRWATTISFT